MFLRPARRPSSWVASPDFVRMFDVFPAAIALCDRDLKPLVTSAALRQAIGLPDPLAWVEETLRGLRAGSKTEPAGYAVDFPHQRSGEAKVTPAAGVVGQGGYWVEFTVNASAGAKPDAAKPPFAPSTSYAELDRNGVILSASPAFHAAAHQPDGRLVQRPLASLLSDAREGETITSAIGTDEDASGIYRIVSQSGAEAWLSLQFVRGFTGSSADVAAIVFARDASAERRAASNDAAILSALSRSQAVIEFKPDGTILTANANFLKALDYSSLSDVVGRHHRIFVFRNDQNTPEYATFWRRLAAGEFFTGRFRRATRNGGEIWIEASYNPVFDLDGKVVKIVKFATDITGQMVVSRKVSASLSMVEAVASGSEQMSVSIREISGTMQSAREAVTRIGDSVEQSVNLVEGLSASAHSMERVIALIKGIASKVNLLALNATIEAARAGSAGKSFAVVAGEVKTLAAQTNDAIGEIEKEIKAMQSVSLDVRGNVEGISQSVSKVTASVGMVASAITEQTQATAEISHNITMIAAAISELSDLVNT